VELAILGPLEVRADGRTLTLGGPKQRALLAILLLDRNRVVSRDRLLDGLWGERPPATAERSIESYVSRLRALLGAERIERRAPGYLIRIEPGELDLDRFETLLEQGRACLRAGDAATASQTLHQALALWRGAPFADLMYQPFADREVERLEELRLLALEERIEADLALGKSAELVPELEATVREHPFRERPLAQLMLALYRAGRQADALAAFQTGRRRLHEELGLEPGPELRELQRTILAQDPALAAPAAALPVRQEQPRVNRSKRAAVGVAAAAVAASAAIGIVLGTRGTSATGVSAGSSEVVGLSISSGAPSNPLELTDPPGAMTAGNGSLWIADPSGGAVSQVDLAEGAVVDRVPVGLSPAVLAQGGGSIWAAGVPGDTVVRIDPATGAVTQRVPLRGARAAALSFGEGGLWIADITDDMLIELDPGSGLRRRTLKLPLKPTALALGDGVVWVADYEAGSVAEVDLRTGETLATVHVGNGPAALALGSGSVWVANALDSTVSKLDPTSGSVVATIPVGSSPTAIAVAGGGVWVANRYSATVSRIDPNRNAVVQTNALRGAPTALTSAEGKIFIGTRPLIEHRGGTLVLVHTRPISIDPALHFDLLPLASDRLTRDGLVAYNHVPGSAGIQLVPDLAVSLPLPTDGGTTYTFRLRPRIRYSDGTRLSAGDFRRAIERMFRLRSQGRVLFANIVGGEACSRNSDACDLSRGIVTDETARTVTFHLRAPDPDFLESLTTGGLATPVPPDAPFHDTGFEPIPGTGPYMITSASRREIRYVRNPFFREWSHAARPGGNPDEIVMRFGLDPKQEVRAIQEGRADWMADFVPGQFLPSLRTRFASRLHRATIPTTDFFQFNTTRPPFDDVRVRRALNFAIDRRAIVRMYGGQDLATATCQILPPGVPGYRAYCPYTRSPDSSGAWTAPDLRQAQRLVAASGTRGTPVTVWGWTDDPTISPGVVRYAADVLRRLGYPVRVRLVPHSFLAHAPPERFSRIQLIPAAWGGDTPDGFFTTWFSCKGPNVHGWVCNRRIDRAILRARALKATKPRAAAALWGKIDRDLVDQAAWVPFIDEQGVDFVSARMRNYQFHPYWGFIADQVWLR